MLKWILVVIGNSDETDIGEAGTILKEPERM